MFCRAQGEDALLGAGFLLVAPRAAEGRVELVFVERLLEALRLHYVGVQTRARVDRIDAGANTLLVDMDDEIEAEVLRMLVAEGDHLAELPCRVDVEQREGGLGRIEGLHRQMQQDCGVLADGIKDDRLVAGRRHLAEDLHAFGFKPAQVIEAHAGAPVRVILPSGPMCRPHSFLPSSSHHQRPARSGSPGATARVQGAQPIDRKPRS